MRCGARFHSGRSAPHAHLSAFFSVRPFDDHALLVDTQPVACSASTPAGRAAMAYRTRSIADLSTPSSASWTPNGNGQKQSDVTVPQRATALPSLRPAQTNLSESIDRFHHPTAKFMATNYWPAAGVARRSSINNFNPGDRRRFARTNPIRPGGISRIRSTD